jgi:rubrerythrin
MNGSFGLGFRIALRAKEVLMKKADPGHMTENMTKASGTEAGSTPQKGDTYHCDSCGMEIKVTADCQCPSHPAFQCCGQDMHKT